MTLAAAMVSACGSNPDGEAVAAYALGQVGKPYSFGQAGPERFDCSGLAKAAWATREVRLSHNARRQYDEVDHIAKKDMRAGDLVFYYRPIHHVAIYVGEGNVVHAPDVGQTVRVSPVDSMPFTGAGRPHH